MSDIEKTNQSFSDRITNTIIKNDVGDTITHSIGQGDNQRTFFPTRYEKPDYKYEEKINTALSLRPIGEKIFGQNVPDDFYKYALEKEKAAGRAKFNEFILSSIDPNNPTQVENIRNLYPEIFSEPVKVFNEKLERLKRWFEIKLHGCKTREDYELFYLVSNGTIPEPDLGALTQDTEGKINSTGGFINRDPAKIFKGYGLGQKQTNNVQSFKMESRKNYFADFSKLVKGEARDKPLTINFLNEANPNDIQFLLQFVSKFLNTIPEGALFKDNQDVLNFISKSIQEKLICDPYGAFLGYNKILAIIFNGQQYIETHEEFKSVLNKLVEQFKEKDTEGKEEATISFITKLALVLGKDEIIFKQTNFVYEIMQLSL
ncbi:hypothetical protein ACTFIY_004562 [Dictyostelium cf. discoideum]